MMDLLGALSHRHVCNGDGLGLLSQFLAGLVVTSKRGDGLVPARSVEIRIGLHGSPSCISKLKRRRKTIRNEFKMSKL